MIDLARRSFVAYKVHGKVLMDAVRSIPGAKYDAKADAWMFPIACAAYVAEYANDHAVQMTESARMAVMNLVVNRDAGIDMPDLDAPLRNGRILFAHQKEGVRFLLRRRYGILADDMGLGKSTTALVAAAALEGSVHVICPASLRDNWQREADMVGVKIQTHSWAKVPVKLVAPYILIADEAHYVQAGTKSQRGKAFLALAKDADAVFCLTGTPMKNGRPANLLPLLKAVRSPLAADKAWFERRYCDAKPTRWSRWDTTGAARLPELGRRCAPVMLRRMKDECLDLPEKIRVMREADVTADARRAYEAEMERLATRSESEPDALAMFTYLRMASSQAKIESACTIIDEVIEQGGSIVVFTAFLAAARALAHRYGETSALLIGETAQDERQRLVDEFQAGKRRVFVTTFGAGGVGITLTKAQTVLLVDRPWTPGDCYQAEDRIHRIGQTGSSVLSIWLQWDDTDKAVDALLEAKTERIEVVMHGRKVEVEANISLQRFAEMATRK